MNDAPGDASVASPWRPATQQEQIQTHVEAGSTGGAQPTNTKFSRSFVRDMTTMIRTTVQPLIEDLRIENRQSENRILAEISRSENRILQGMRVLGQASRDEALIHNETLMSKFVESHDLVKTSCQTFLNRGKEASRQIDALTTMVEDRLQSLQEVREAQVSRMDLAFRCNDAEYQVAARDLFNLLLERTGGFSPSSKPIAYTPQPSQGTSTSQISDIDHGDTSTNTSAVLDSDADTLNRASNSLQLDGLEGVNYSDADGSHSDSDVEELLGPLHSLTNSTVPTPFTSTIDPQALAPAAAISSPLGLDNAERGPVDEAPSPLSSLSSLSDTSSDTDEPLMARYPRTVKRERSLTKKDTVQTPRKRMKTEKAPARKSSLKDVKWPPIKGGEFFIQCDDCELWFHGKCQGMETDPGWENPDLPFKCSRCEQVLKWYKKARAVIGYYSPSKKCCARPHCPDNSTKMEIAANVYIMERLVGRRPAQLSNSKGTYEFRVKWSGYPLRESTWEPLEHLSERGNPMLLITEFMKTAVDEGLDIAPTNAILLKEAQWLLEEESDLSGPALH